MNKSILRDIVNRHSAQMKPVLRELMDIVGFDALCKLSEEYGGSFIYIPLESNLFSKCIAEQIRQEYNGGNIRELAKKYEMAQNTVRNILF